MSTPFFSIILTADTRPGSDLAISGIGDYGKGSLQGVRSFDFLTDLPVTIANFFSGYNYDLNIFIDEHMPIPPEVLAKMEMLRKLGILHRWDCRPRDRQRYKWNDHHYKNSLATAHPDATHIVKIDQDCAMFRDPNSDIVARYISWLSTSKSMLFQPYSYVCQPSSPGDKPWHASTRFFVTRAGTMDLAEIERTFDHDYIHQKYGHKYFCACFESNLGLLCDGNVLYPEPREEEYTIFSWSTYRAGLLRKLNSMPYEAVQEYVKKCGIHGARDLVAQEL